MLDLLIRSLVIAGTGCSVAFGFVVLYKHFFPSSVKGKVFKDKKALENWQKENFDYADYINTKPAPPIGWVASENARRKDAEIIADFARAKETEAPPPP